MVETVQERENITKEIHTAVRHGAVYGLGTILAKALGFLMVPVYTHYLSPVDFGVLEILDLSMTLFGMFLNMGMTAALLRCYAAAASEEEKRTTVSTAFIFVTATGVITLLLGLGSIRAVSTLIFGPSIPPKYLLLSFVSFILGYICNLPRIYLRAREASGSYVTIDTLSIVVVLALNIVFIVVLQIGLIGILLSSLISVILQVVLLSAWTLREVGFRFSRRLLEQMVRFGLPLIFSNMALFTLNFSDRFFLQHLRSLDVVGIYAVGYKFGFMVNYLLVQPFLVMWQSRMYIIYTKADHAKIFGQIFTLYSMVLTYAGLALALLSPEIVRFMVDPKFSASKDVIPIVAGAYVIWGVGYYVQVGMFLTNRTSVIGAISVAAAGLNLALNYLLIGHYGMLGAAWATLFSFLAIAVANYRFSQRFLPLPLGMRRVAVAMCLGLSLYLVSRWWSPASIAIALLIKILFLCAFPLILWKARILSPAEIGTLASTRDSVAGGVSRLLGRRSQSAVSL
jgi:O-antigen/teichoic acid export membrane protein